MASAAVKLAVVCVLVVSLGQLMKLASVDDVTDAAQLRLNVLAAELALLDDGVGKLSCSSINCQKCLLLCGLPCVFNPPNFVPCVLACASGRDCFGKK